MNNRYIQAAVRLVVVMIIGAWVVSLPEPEADSALHFKNAGVVLVGVVLGGNGASCG